MNGLSDRAKQLIPKARIVSFAGWQDMPPEAIAIFQRADDASQYLTDNDLATLSTIMPSPTNHTSQGISVKGMDTADIDAIAVVQQLRDQAADIVDEAREGVLQAFPGIVEPGGGLYPPMRADACWRDFWQFLRCITYGIAGGHTHYTSPDGLAAMEQLYDELQVPLPAMLSGIKGIKKASLNRLDLETHTALEPYFNHLIERLSSFLT